MKRGNGFLNVNNKYSFKDCEMRTGHETVRTAPLYSTEGSSAGK